MQSTQASTLLPDWTGCPHSCGERRTAERTFPGSHPPVKLPRGVLGALSAPLLLGAPAPEASRSAMRSL